METFVCPNCRGVGWESEKICSFCGGGGHIPCFNAAEVSRMLDGDFGALLEKAYRDINAKH